MDNLNKILKVIILFVFLIIYFESYVYAKYDYNDIQEIIDGGNIEEARKIVSEMSKDEIYSMIEEGGSSDLDLVGDAIGTAWRNPGSLLGGDYSDDINKKWSKLTAKILGMAVLAEEKSVEVPGWYEYKRKGDDKSMAEVFKESSIEELYSLMVKYDIKNMPKELKEDLKNKVYPKINNDTLAGIIYYRLSGHDFLKAVEMAKIVNGEKGSTEIYIQPKIKDSYETANQGLNGIIEGGTEFTNSGNIHTVTSTEIQNLSSMLYNILLTIGVIVAVAIGGIIGIKLMISSAEEKAEIKQFLVPYVIGCLVLFGSFGIWKLVVIIMDGIV